MNISFLSNAFRGYFVGLIAMFALSSTNISLAAPPYKQYFGPFQYVGFVIGDCGSFEIWNDVSEEGFVTWHFDQEGNVTHVNAHFMYTDSIYYNSEHPEIFLVGGPVEIPNNHNSGDSKVIAGLGIKITVPGYGVIYHEAGRLILDINTFEVLFQAGPKDFLEGNVTALCLALRP